MYGIKGCEMAAAVNPARMIHVQCLLCSMWRSPHWNQMTHSYVLSYWWELTRGEWARFTGARLLSSAGRTRSVLAEISDLGQPQLTG